MTCSLSVLDFDSSLARAASLAPIAEALGYSRYWFAEHPPQANCEMLAAITAQITSKMRIGTGGVVIRLRNVFQSASNFLFLAAAYGDRIDAGICGGWAAAEITAALADNSPDDFSQRCRDWVQYIRGTNAPDHLAGLRRPNGLPELWLLGTGARSALLAAELGVSFAYSIFHRQSQDDPSLMDQYRSAFQPRSRGAVAKTMLAVAGICGSTDEEARTRLASAPQWSLVVNSNIVGSVQVCRARLRELRERYRPDEIIILEQSRTPLEAATSLALFAEAAR